VPGQSRCRDWISNCGVYHESSRTQRFSEGTRAQSVEHQPDGPMDIANDDVILKENSITHFRNEPVTRTELPEHFEDVVSIPGNQRVGTSTSLQSLAINTNLL
jgi:hypothetical protein